MASSPLKSGSGMASLRERLAKDAIAARFQLIGGEKPPQHLDTLWEAFEFCSAIPPLSPKPLRIGVRNADGRLALLCGLQGFAQAKEFAGILAQLGYEPARDDGEHVGCEFVYAMPLA